jgi:hypothetical protein
MMSPNPKAEPKPTITRNSSEFNQDAYASIPAGELVVFAVQVLQADGSPAATEDIVSICFRFFPHSFALKNYFYWPDSALVTRRLHDAKEKGALKGNAADGFETKVQGRQAAKHAAKALGVLLPLPPKVEAPVVPPAQKKESVTGEKKEEEKKEPSPSAPELKVVKKQVTSNKKEQKKVKGEKKKTGKKPAVKRQAAKPKVQALPKKVVVTPVKKKPAPKPKAQAKPAKKPKVTVAKSLVAKVEKKEERRKKPAPKARVEKRKAQKVKTQNAKATQLAMPLSPPAAWKKAGVPAIKPKSQEEAPPIGDKKPVKKEAAAPAAISKEEKVKAAKVVKQIERSDAYQLYRRNGRRAHIGEFDFRNMLFATMESSAETLKRNVDLFKRYAGIQYRSDLVAFLEFCEGHFAALLKSKAKQSLRR